MNNRIVLERVSAGYGAVTVLHDVSLEVREGELVALLGMNGNGKSTLLNCILGFVRPTSGRILMEWGGRVTDLTAMRPHDIVNLGIGAVPEGRRLVPTLSVEDNLSLAGGVRRGRGSPAETLAFCYETFPILRERRRQAAGTLSGGQQQMLAIARALMTAPRFMVVDEPSVGLAPIVVDQVIDAVKQLQTARGMTILMAEQSFFQAVEVAARAYVLSHGRIIRTVEQGRELADGEEIRRTMMGMA
ncbi:ABC transporter ATP-binding protein [Arenibaculum pallidiluteum]|uniref:ABC transporter ATP-binding protein n=1 Tax=Arenibaculum pallidiluteum TaxID=2812559 RepID=UPI002E29A99C|nr:ABC transporter ATP-binding protein [Arenibaculum pallidiluteum]